MMVSKASASAKVAEIQDDGGGHHADFSGKLLENLLANGRR